MVEQGQKPLVTITGITGYLGSQTAFYFLQDGGYRVRGTVRSMANPVKIDPIKKGLGELFSQLDIVEADLLDAESMKNAVVGSDYVIHTASPYILANITDAENQLMKPAVEGTQNVLDACAAAGTIKRLVITSSVAAVIAPMKADFPADSTFDETNWTHPNSENLHPYRKSKTVAERLAWDYQEKLPADKKFEITTICPGFIMGPSIASGDALSENWAIGIVTGSTKSITKKTFPFVDVRDTALAHLYAVKVAEAANQRFLLVEDTLRWLDAAQMIADEFKPKGFPVTLTEDAEGDLTKCICKREKSEKVLGVKYTPMRQSLKDMIESLIASGKIQEPQK